jgi:hypothetical protein
VPALVVSALVDLTGRWNWWMPDGLTRLLRIRNRNGHASPSTSPRSPSGVGVTFRVVRSVAETHMPTPAGAGAVHTDEFAQLRDLFPLVLERAFLEIVSDVEDERPSHGTSLDR